MSKGFLQIPKSVVAVGGPHGLGVVTAWPRVKVVMDLMIELDLVKISEL